MRLLRIIVTLLLCLTVPVSGWASVLEGSLCPREQHADHVERALPQHAVEHAVVETGHASHCDGASDHGKPCKGDACGCGCAFGACSSASISLLAGPPFALFAHRGTQAIPGADRERYVGARGNSLLRPPIS